MKSLRYGIISLALLSALCGTASAGSLFGTRTAPAAPDGATANSQGGSGGLPDDQPLDDRFYAAPLFSYAPASNSRHSNDGIGGTLVIGKPILPHLSIELLGDYLRYKGKTDTTLISTNGEICAVAVTSGLCREVTTQYPNSNLYSGGAGANVYLSHTNSGFFLHADAMYGNRFVYDAGPGLDIPLGTAQRFSLRGEALYHKEDGYKAGPEFNLGMLLRFGKRPERTVAPPPEPVAVVPVQAPVAPPPPPPCETPAPGEPINLDGCKTGDTFVLRGVNFEFNSANLTVNAKQILDQVAAALASRPDLKVELDGHTDGIGSLSYNQKLSERRADSVKAYLVAAGIADARLSTRGFGKTMPVATNSTEEGRDLNRRVELKITDSLGTVVEPVSSGATDTVAPTANTGGAGADPVPPAAAAAPSADGANAEPLASVAEAPATAAATPSPTTTVDSAVSNPVGAASSATGPLPDDSAVH